MNFKIGSHGFHLSLTAIALIAGAVFAFIRFGGPSAALEQWQAGGKREVASHAPFLKRIREAEARAEAHRARARRLAADTLRLHQTYDSLWALASAAVATGRKNGQMGDAARVLAEANQACQDRVANCEQRAVAAENADNEEKARAALATARANTADSVVKAGLGAVECHLVHLGPVKLFGCPSRVTAFKVGAVAGVSIWEAAKKLLTGKW